MNCRPTTSGTGRWTCETCGADLGDGTAPYLGTLCPGRDDSAPPVEFDGDDDCDEYGDGWDEYGDGWDDDDYEGDGPCECDDCTDDDLPPAEPDPSDYDRGIADAVAVIETMLTAPFGYDHEAPTLTRARDAVAALKRGDA